MSDLPKEIADMCGVVVGSKTEAPPQENNESLFQMQQDKDGIYRVTYNGENVGWIEPVPKNAYHPEKYRALSVHGKLGYFWTLDVARTFLMERYY
jgi:hypothetical protein